jgi:hypothetical protein
MGTPQFFHVATPVTGPGYTWAGAYPYIDTPDLGASYGEINNFITGDPGGQWVGYYLPAYTAPAGVTGARVDFQINTPVLDAYYHGPIWRLACDDLITPWSWGNNPYPSAVAGWNTFADTYTFDGSYGPEYDLPAMLAALASGNLRFFAMHAQIDVTFQVSQLRLTLISTGIPPLRQVQRDDGLGRSVVRARGGTSIQRSIRQRGYR